MYYEINTIETEDLKYTAPKDFIGYLFLNTDGVYNILHEIEDIIKSAQWFGNRPVDVILKHNDGSIIRINHQIDREMVFKTRGGKELSAENKAAILDSYMRVKEKAELMESL